MKHFTFISFLLVTCLTTTGQTDSSKYYFPEIRMTIYIPNSFKNREPLAPPPQYYDGHGRQISDSVVLKRITKDDPKVLLHIESLDRENIIEIRLIPITKTLIHLLGDSIQYVEFAKKMIIAGVRQATEEFDTLFTKVKIDNLIFNKLFTISNINGVKYYEGSYFTKIGKYYLVANMFFREKDANVIMKIFESSKFQ